MQFKLLENSYPFNEPIKNMIKKEKEESHNKYTKKRKFVCGVVATKRKSSFVVFLENGALF